MTYPNFANKQSEKSIVSPGDYVSYLEKIGKSPTYGPPECVIFCYSHRLLQYIREYHPVTEVTGFVGEKYLLDDSGGKTLLVGNFGVGAPVVVTLLEELIAYGARKFISIGTAGTLQKDINIGDIVVCDRAIRDEGTSHHYLSAAKYVSASQQISKRLKRSLEKFNQPYVTGSSWTIDAPYRETIAEARAYQAEGVATVDMEAAALFAVAEYREVELGALFTISDSLADFTWDPNFHSQETQDGLETLYRVALDASLAT